MKTKMAAFLLVFIPSLLLAREPGAAFLGADTSVRSVALGGVFTAAQGAEALGSNPALIFPVKGKSELYTSFSQLYEETTDGHLAMATTLKSKHAWGLSATLRDEGKTIGRDEGGQSTGAPINTHHEMVGGAFSWGFLRGARAGISGNIFQSTLAGVSSGVSWAMDAGISYHPKHFLYSLSVNHLGPGIKYIEQRDPLPGRLQLDGSWEPGPMTVLMGYHHALNGSGAEGAVGVEYRVKALALRLGLHTTLGGASNLAYNNQSSADQLLNSLTTGFGFQMGKSLCLDYAYKQNAPEWGPAHSFALAWSWRDTPRPPAPPKRTSTMKQTSPRPSTNKKAPLHPRIKLNK
jgi:hypothetical protein